MPSAESCASTVCLLSKRSAATARTRRCFWGGCEGDRVPGGGSIRSIGSLGATDREAVFAAILTNEAPAPEAILAAHAE